MSNSLKQVGKEFKQFRREINKSHKQMVLRCGKKSTSELSRFENGKQNMEFTNFMKYITLYNYTLLIVPVQPLKNKVNPELHKLTRYYSEDEILAVWNERRNRRRGRRK